MKMSGQPGGIMHHCIQYTGCIYNTGQSAENKKDQTRRSGRQTGNGWNPGKAVYQRKPSNPREPRFFPAYSKEAASVNAVIKLGSATPKVSSPWNILIPLGMEGSLNW